MPIGVGQENQPCLRCGSLAKTINMQFLDEVGVSPTDWLEVKATNVTMPSKRKMLRHLQTGSQWSTSREKFVDKVRDIDRDADTYYERVVDSDTGDVLRHCEEPLSQHFGRGSAKPKQESQPIDTDPPQGDPEQP